MKLFWKLYSCLFLAIVLTNAVQLLNKDSMIGVYYNTTIVFSNWYIIPYFLNILNALTTSIVCLFIIGYAFNIKNFYTAPQWLFYARLLTDCTGHSYEVKMIQSGFAQGNYWGMIAIASLVFPILPSYIVQFRMTFIKK